VQGDGPIAEEGLDFGDEKLRREDGRAVQGDVGRTRERG
jgi:hypothetical protein